MTDPQELELYNGRRLPSATDLRKQLRLGLEAVITEERKNREVHGPEDTYPLQRRLGGIEETAKDYGNAFRDFARDVRAVVEEELIEAVGDQDGIPNIGITIPDTDGTDLKVTVDVTNSYDIDVDALDSAVVFEILHDRADTIKAMFEAEYRGDGEASQGALADVLAHAMRRARDQGKFQPQVSKVRQLARSLARRPDGEKLASTVMDAVTKSPIYKGVKVERVQPKESRQEVGDG
jgi:hypothetical protein